MGAPESALPEERSFPHFPIRYFTVVLALTAVVLILLANAIYGAYGFMRDDLVELRRLEHLRGSILHLDEVLTMSARMAAATGDLAWEQRYNRFEPQLADEIREATELASFVNSQDPVRTDAANIRLVELERKSFSLVRVGKAREATAILFGTEYEAQKQVYAEGMTLLELRMSEVVEALVGARRRQTQYALIGVGALLPCLLAAWFVVVRRIRQWQRSIMELNNRVVQRTLELTALNRGLDQRVADRTETLQQSEERFRQLAENIREVFWITDCDRKRIVYVSPAYQETWGRSCATLHADPDSWWAAVPEENRAEASRFPLGAAAGVKVVAEYPIVRPDGSRRWIRDRAFPIRDASGGVYRLAGVAEDITESREAEEGLRQSQKMQAVGRLAGGIAHDFNNLLTGIIGYVHLLLARFGVGDPSRLELEEVLKAAERAAGLTRQLLIFSRKQVVQLTRLDLNAVLADMDKMLKRLIGEDVQFATVLRPELWNVRADAGQIQQVVMNLVLNARDAMPQGGRLTVETANLVLEAGVAATKGLSPGDFVMIAVTDTGTGMTPEVQARVFEPFFTTKEQGKGTGLGLSTVFGIVTYCGGQITCYSEPGHGSTFKVCLPRFLEEEATASVPAAAADLPRGQERILVVEDEDLVRNLIMSLLEIQGYRVVAARNGEEALALLAADQESFDLVITDVVMPRMGGIEMARKLGGNSSRLRMLFISGYPDGALAQNGELPGDAPFLSKPFQVQTLLQKVRETIDAPVRSE